MNCSRSMLYVTSGDSNESLASECHISCQGSRLFRYSDEPGTLAGTYAAAPALTRQRRSQQSRARASASPALVERTELSCSEAGQPRAIRAYLKPLRAAQLSPTLPKMVRKRQGPNPWDAGEVLEQFAGVSDTSPLSSCGHTRCGPAFSVAHLTRLDCAVGCSAMAHSGSMYGIKRVFLYVGISLGEPTERAHCPAPNPSSPSRHWSPVPYLIVTELD